MVAVYFLEVPLDSLVDSLADLSVDSLAGSFVDSLG